MSLLELQRSMREAILADDDPAEALAHGMEIYRNAYRSRLLDALKTGFERTMRWVGDEAFEAAACHHIILNPPSSWTLDDYGAGFDQTLAQLFAQDPEVAELAWLEWHMSRAFAAVDLAVLQPAELLAGPLADGNWDLMRLEFVTGFAMREIASACTSVWLGLNSDEAEAPAELMLAEPETLIVWRKGLSPHFRLVEADEAAALSALAGGAAFGEACDELAGSVGPETAVSRVGTWLGQWLNDGLVSRLSFE